MKCFVGIYYSKKNYLEYERYNEIVCVWVILENLEWWEKLSRKIGDEYWVMNVGWSLNKSMCYGVKERKLLNKWENREKIKIFLMVFINWMEWAWGGGLFGYAFIWWVLGFVFYL